MYNDVITLLNIEKTVNCIGDQVETVTRKDVFAEVKSVGMKETYIAMSVELKPELVFVIADYYDYDDQKDIEYDGKRYKVIRTYRKGASELEIVVTR